MAKNCTNCGKNINFFSNDPFESNGVILCYDCAKPVTDDINRLYYLKSKSSFYALKDEIITKSKEMYSDEIVNSIELKINLIHENIKELLKDDIQHEDCKSQTTEKVQPKYSVNKKNSSNEGLYTNIGHKIKNLAKILFIIEAIAAIIIGICLIEDWQELIGTITIIAGPIIAWISSWILYAFGELVEKTCASENHLRNILEFMQESKNE